MTRTRSLGALFTGLLLLACATGPGRISVSAAQSAASAYEEVRLRERQWLDAYERADAEAMGDILADEFVIIYPSGRRFDRADTLNQVRRSPGGTRFWTEGVQASGDRPQVVLSGVVVSESASRQTRQSYTDVWKWNGDRWQVASSTLSEAPAQ